MCTACYIEKTGLKSGKYPHDYGKDCVKKFNKKFVKSVERLKK